MQWDPITVQKDIRKHVTAAEFTPTEPIVETQKKFNYLETETGNEFEPEPIKQASPKRNHRK